MTYQEINEQIAQMREVIRQKNKEMKEAEENAQLDKDLINWQPEEISDLLSDILVMIEGLNERVKKLERKLKET